jgi:glycosyltransferase involved in cell wall biosynthesis
VRIGLDATPLLGPRSGVGRYVAELVRALSGALEPADEVVLTAFTLRGAGQLGRLTPPGVSARSRPFSARLLQAAWSRSSFPPVGLLSGRVDLFHGTNFVLPPPGRAAGVVTVHDLAFLHLSDTVSAASRRYIDLVPRSLRRAGVVCVPSRFVAEQVTDAYPAAAGKVTVTPLGVDPAWSGATPPAPDRLAAHGLTREYLLFIGNLEPRKDVATVLAAYRLLIARGRADLPQLALAGPSGWGEELDLSGLPEGLVVRLGRQPEEQLRALVAGARAVLYPSRYEGFGLPVLEAFACGTPLIASDLPTTREIVGPETLPGQELASFFPVGDFEALAELLVTEPDDRPETRSRRTALTRAWTWDRTARATVAAYRQAAG